MTDPTRRPLTPAETALARSVYGDAIRYDEVRISERKWAFFQPKGTVMAPSGTIHFHPKGGLCCADFGAAGLDAQGLFIHEMCHVWQHQRGVYLPLARHPFCRYDYALKPGWPLKRYGIEQQAEIVRHAFLLRHRGVVPGAPGLAHMRRSSPFSAPDRAARRAGAGARRTPRSSRRGPSA